ncbi:acyl carrier protein [Paenibacillus aurantiacus]|uniref:Acyl carrier protein n=1 Tax=Paenibacillus aurantiacus TaxID=1936118 RepID=A0ABV5KSJ6_9BACL
MTGRSMEEIKQFLKRSAAALTNNPLVERELDDFMPIQSIGIDSMQLIHLVVQIETEYDIVFEDDEMLLENFKTIAIIADRIMMKLGVAL